MIRKHQVDPKQSTPPRAGSRPVDDRQKPGGVPRSPRQQATEALARCSRAGSAARRQSLTRLRVSAGRAPPRRGSPAHRRRWAAAAGRGRQPAPGGLLRQREQVPKNFLPKQSPWWVSWLLFGWAKRTSSAELRVHARTRSGRRPRPSVLIRGRRPVITEPCRAASAAWAFRQNRARPDMGSSPSAGSLRSR